MADAAQPDPAQPDPALTDAALERLLETFLALRLPAAEWTHEAHLLVAMMLARRLPQAQLLPALRQAIGAHNLATGGQNTAEAGYHESITAFYAAVLFAYAQATARMPAAEAAARLLRGPLARRDVILRAYAPETLKTPQARLGYRAPDRADYRPERLAAEAVAAGFDRDG